jgi:hypothetical protein
MDGSLNAPPTTPKVQVLTEVMVDGGVYLPGDRRYDRARQPWNRMIDPDRRSWSRPPASRTSGS